MNITDVLKNNIQQICQNLCNVKSKCYNIYEIYWNTNASTTISGYSDGDALTFTSKLTKAEFSSGITLCEQLNNFFNNSAVTQADYLQTCHNILYGTDQISVPINDLIEYIADEIKELSQTLLNLYQIANTSLIIYTSHELDLIVAAISGSTFIPGSNITKTDFNNAMVLCEQFKKFIENQSVTTGDYKTTVADWCVY